MEKPLNSSETCSKDLHHCRFFRRSRMICENGTPNLKNTQAGSFSCQCSTTSIGQEKETMEFVFRIQKIKEYAKRFSQGHWTFLGPGEEKKWCGILPWTHKEKWDSTSTRVVERFKDTGHPVFKSISTWSRGILKKKNDRDTIHFNADALNTELLFRIIHSVNQLSIYGAALNWCEQFGLTEEEIGQERIRDQKRVYKCEVTNTTFLKSNMLTPKTKLADILTKASFSRDEWNHLLRLLNIMSFSMYLCSHFSNFLSDPIGKQSAMSRRGQETTSSSEGETSQLGVLRSPWSGKEHPPQDLGYPVNPGNVDQGGGDRTGPRRLVRASTRRTQHSKHEIHQPSEHDEDLPFPTKEVGNYSNSTFSMEALKTNGVHFFVNESSHSSWAESFGERGLLQDHELRGNSELLQCHTEIDIGAFWRNSECEYD